MSLPSWERGLKFDLKYSPYASLVVAPLVGAWIEIDPQYTILPMVTVAPLVGAWIEISEPFTSSAAASSLPSWERGLK